MAPLVKEDRETPVLRARRPGKSSMANPLQSGIHDFLQSELLPDAVVELASLPKRYTLYSPLLLLPATFTTHTPAWRTVFSSLTEPRRQCLFKFIATAFRGQGVTHIAINAPIAPSVEDKGTENVMRSPSGFAPVFGDFGPEEYAKDGPSVTDFESAFWVSIIQHQGVVQCWAPRWTMFSRGNISEKARILGDAGAPFPGLSDVDLGESLGKVDVVDMYVGIGYFALSYLKRGVRRVFGWDINGWSIEGLRRGCNENGWRCLVVKVDEKGQLIEQTIDDLVQIFEEGDRSVDPVRCIAFWGDNEWAGDIDARLQEGLQAHAVDQSMNTRHINLGLLPSSQQSWKGAVHVLSPRKGGWLHVHENVDVKEIQAKQAEIVEELRLLCSLYRPGPWQVQCSHVEQVKSYAPGVMHCVFDISISPVG